ncbi:MAG: sulfatase-like hydrolase/transferase [Planctomycetes bacterium]|nr:sulfatase-like hydrolase/transferase [Planctomycetota bacterium]
MKRRRAGRASGPFIPWSFSAIAGTLVSPAFGGEIQPPAPPPNVLIVIADDLGVDMVPAYGEGTDLPVLPVIDSLATSGVLFRNAYVNPLCSPTRACLQTGRHSFRTGLGCVVHEEDEAVLPASEVTLPEMLDIGTGALYAHGCFGKWHLHSKEAGGLAGPNDAGWSHFAGSLLNLDARGSHGYFDWEKVTNGVASQTNVYATTDTVDSALAWLAGASEPWLCCVAFNAPHAPWHVPPAGLYSQDLSSAPPATVDPRPYYKAVVEALDCELGRLLSSIDPLVMQRTTVIFIADNGTPGPVVAPPIDEKKAKGTVFEGGINVPLIVAGPLVLAPGSQCAALVHGVDVFPTVAEIAGVDLETALPGATVDGMSLVRFLANPALPSAHAYDFAERFGPNLIDGEPYPESMCQKDLGLGGPGGSCLSACGQPLFPGNTALLSLENGPPGALALLLASFTFAPFPIAGGLLIPSPYFALLPVPLDPQGSLTLTVPGGPQTIGGQHAIICQVVAPDAGLPFGWSFSNMVKLSFLDAPYSKRALRNVAGYKLTRVTTTEGAKTKVVDSLYDLEIDPLEVSNLLGAGAPGLTPEQLAAYQELVDALEELLATED